MKVFIITEGGRDIGFGHLTRCISLCQAFEKRKIASEFIINGDDTIRNLLEDKRCRIFNWLKEKDRLFEIIKDASIVIVDSYLADEQFYKRVSETAEIPVYMDDNMRIDYPRGFIVNSTIDAEELNYPNRETITYLLGSQYTPLRKEFWAVQEKKIKDNIESIMITFGGDDMRDLAPRILNFLIEEYPEYKKNVVIGGAFQNKNIKKIKELRDKRTNLFYNPKADELKEIMLESDIAISAGGQVLYEFARMGMPTIGICVSGNQERNLKGWQKEGFVEYAGWYDDNNLKEKLKKSIEHLANIDIRKNKSLIAKRFVDGKGSLRAVKTVLSKLFKNKLVLRKAALCDAPELLSLYNDDIVRRNSFNPEKIGWGHHLKWLTQKLKDNNCVFLIADMSDTFLGQIRFDIVPEKKEAIVNIGLKKDVRGLGLSPFILNKSICELSKIRSDINLIKAYIKEKNTPSIRAFEETDFKFFEDAIVKSNKAKVYIKEIKNAGVCNEV